MTGSTLIEDIEAKNQLLAEMIAETQVMLDERPPATPAHRPRLAVAVAMALTVGVAVGVAVGFCFAAIRSA
jgi:hypothetical protein